MESVSDVYMQSEHKDGNQLSPECVRTPLVSKLVSRNFGQLSDSDSKYFFVLQILRQILKHFSNHELLQLSLVDKQWNYEARTLIKYRGTMNAHIDSSELSNEFDIFTSLVRQNNVVPFSGICVHFNHDVTEEDHDSTICAALNSSIDVIFNRGLKHFGVQFDRFREVKHKCQAFLSVEKILRDHCGVLESLCVALPKDCEDLMPPSTQQPTFPRLKTFKVWGFSGLLTDISPENFYNGTERSFIKTIVSRAPNLEELYLDYPVNDFKELLEGSSAVLMVHSKIDPLDDWIPHDLIGAFRLKKMRLEYATGDWNSFMERFNHIVPVVLKTSRSTLEKLSLESVFFPSLMRYGIRLENVTKLTIQLNSQEPEVPQCMASDMSAFLRILQDFDFTRIFPKLNEVKISTAEGSLSPQEMSQFVDQGNVISQQPISPDRAVNIKRLKLKELPTNVPFLASVFPHIETLEIWDEPEPPFALVWEHLVHLKQLIVHAKRLCEENWDSFFCGIFPEEVAELRGKDDEYLKAVNIVPVMPSITCMKELKSFTLCNADHGLVNGEIDPKFIVSKVTALIAVSRCTNLSVRKCLESHENPYDL